MDPATRGATPRGSALGVLPSLIGWAALLTPMLGVPEVGLGHPDRGLHRAPSSTEAQMRGGAR